MAKTQLNNLEDLYGHTLGDALSAEKQIVAALPQMIGGATSPDLIEGFEEHLAQTKHHVEQIQELIDNLVRKPTIVECKGMKGLFEEGAELLKEDIGPDVLDAGLIAAAQKVEHYEIAQYGTLITWAEMLGKEDDAEVLQEIKEEEEETDSRLTELAETSVNVDADEEEENYSEESGEGSK